MRCFKYEEQAILEKCHKCKWRDQDFDPANAKVFLRHYDKARLYVVSHNVIQPYSRGYGGFTIKFINLSGLWNIC